MYFVCYVLGVKAVGLISSPLLPQRQGTSHTELLYVTDWKPTFLALAGMGNSETGDGFNQWPSISQGRKSPRKASYSSLLKSHTEMRTRENAGRMTLQTCTKKCKSVVQYLGSWEYHPPSLTPFYWHEHMDWQYVRSTRLTRQTVLLHSYVIKTEHFHWARCKFYRKG